MSKQSKRIEELEDQLKKSNERIKFLENSILFNAVTVLPEKDREIEKANKVIDYIRNEENFSEIPIWMRLKIEELMK